MSGYLLDTNIVSTLLREPQGRLAQRIARAGAANVFTSVVVAAELEYRGVRRGSARILQWLGGLFQRLEVRPLEASAISHYARLRVALERSGTPIGANDMLIAAHALALDATLVTANEREFSRVQDLAVENWLR